MECVEYQTGDHDKGMPSAEAVRSALEHMLSDPRFHTGERRRAFLRYIVEETLAGRADRLKGYTIGVTVFQRDETFDAHADPVVRLEARRLRRDLDSYYIDAGRQEALRISIPKGSYVPLFEWRAGSDLAATSAETQRTQSYEPSAAESPGAGVAGRIARIAPATLALRDRLSFRRARWLGLVLILVLGGVWLLADMLMPTSSRQKSPAVLVKAFAALTSDEGGALLANGLTNAVVSYLTPFDGLQVFADIPVGDQPYTDEPTMAKIPDYFITGSVERSTERLRVTARLTERASRRVLWSQSYDRPLSAHDILTIEDDISTGIATELAQVYGVINLEVVRRLAEDRPESLEAYECVQRAFLYRLTFERAQYPVVRSCLQVAVRRDPGYADAWAMLAFAHLDAARFHRVSPERAAAELASALSAAQESVDLAPQRVRPLQALAAVRFMRGDFVEAERIQRRAIELNPNDPESLAQLGWRLVARGRSEEGIKWLRQAIERSLRVPAWYNMAMSVAEFDVKAYDLAYAYAVRGQTFCCGLGKATLTVVAAEVGKATEAKAALEAAIAQSPLLARDPHDFWATWHFNEALIDRLNAGLEAAGLSTMRSR